LICGRDTNLGREIAVKVLLESHQGKPELIQRFVEEAQIAGQLQHPGIAPVYEMGQFPDQRPYFTMKLVKGRTLAKLLAERPDPAQDRPRFLKVFEQVCQTLAYAHSRGVIHRDLKPANVMVGAFGEVQVMDWGLAKVLGAGGPALARPAVPPVPEISVIRTVRSEGSDVPGSDEAQTRAGSVLGTPAYMPPEQALGEIDRLDERADVFGLGAVLCEVLTGQPPYVGSDPDAVLRKAVRADLADALARLDGCGAEAELVALAKRCLGVEPEDRPRNAGVVAEAMTAYLAGVQERLRAAEIERATATARAAVERRARRMTVALAAVVVVLVLAGGGGWLWVARQRDAQQAEAMRLAQERDQRVMAELDKVAALQERMAAAPPEEWAALEGEAKAAVEAADAQLAPDAGEELHQRILCVREDLREQERYRRMLVRLEGARFRKVEILSRGGHQQASQGSTGQATSTSAATSGGSGAAAVSAAAGNATASANTSGTWAVGPLAAVDAAFAEAFRQAGLDVQAAEFPQRLRAIRADSLRREVAFALDDWAAGQTQPAARQRLLDLARELDPDPERNMVRALVQGGTNQEALGKLLASVDTMALPPATLVALTSALESAGMVEAATDLLRRAQQSHPADFWINHKLARNLLQKVPSYPADPAGAEALRFATAAVTARPQSIAARLTLAAALQRQHADADAIAVLRRAAALNVHDILVLRRLGKQLEEQGQHEEARRTYLAALAVETAGPDDYFFLGQSFQEQGMRKEAIAAYEKTIRRNPACTVASLELGDLLEASGRAADAVPIYRRAVESAGTDPLRLFVLGRVLAAKGQWDAALEAFRAVKPESDQALLSLARFFAGLTLLQQRKWDEAVAAFRQAIPSGPPVCPAHAALGIALEKKGQPDEAIAAYRKALRDSSAWSWAWSTPVVSSREGAAYAEAVSGREHSLALVLDFTFQLRSTRPFPIPAPSVALCRLLIRQGRTAEACAIIKGAKDVPAYPWLLRDLLAEGGLDDAVAVGRAVIEKNPNDLLTRFQLAQALERQGKIEAALRAYREAIEAAPDDAAGHVALGSLLEGVWRLDDAVAAYEAVKPRVGDETAYHARCQVAKILLGQKKLDEAAAASRQAIRLLPEDALAHAYLGDALAAKGRPEEAIAAYRESLRLAEKGSRMVEAEAFAGIAAHRVLPESRVQYGDTTYRVWVNVDIVSLKLAGLLKRQGRLDDAIAAYRKGIQLKPDAAEVHWQLGLALQEAGQLYEALAPLRRGCELSGNNPNGPGPSLRHLRQADRWAELDRKLPGLLRGEIQPADAAERIDLALMCALPGKGRNVAAARWFAEAFAAQPDLASDVTTSNRYSAVCVAALAGCGQGQDAASLDGKERARWRKQALEWLRADLAVRTWQVEKGKPEERQEAERRLRHWQQDKDLAGLRETDALAKLPAEEQEACRKLWADVEALLAKVREKAN
jgi:tetratricopeptide (TPR) repeat protein